MSVARARSENVLVAQRLREAADHLHAQGASPYSTHAYRLAADAVERCPRDVRSIYDARGVRGLDEIPHVGLGIASAIAGMLVTGQWPLLERLRKSSDPQRLLQLVPGIGPDISKRIQETLHVESLEELEAAAYDGRLQRIPGIGERRLSGWRASLAAMLRRPAA